MSGDILLDHVRRIVEPHGLSCRAMRNGFVRVYAKASDHRTYFLKHDFRRGVGTGSAIKRWLADRYVRAKHVSLRETAEVAG